MTVEFGDPAYERVEGLVTPEQKTRLSRLTPQQVTSTELAGEPIRRVLSYAPGNGAAIGGIKVSSDNGWFAARPAGTESICKIYVERCQGKAHPKQIVKEAQAIVGRAPGWKLRPKVLHVPTSSACC